jgi:hypothetical protein
VKRIIVYIALVAGFVTAMVSDNLPHPNRAWFLWGTPSAKIDSP